MYKESIKGQDWDRQIMKKHSDFQNKPGLHINAVGSDFPGKYELPCDLVKRAFVCPDFLEQALVEGECQQLSRQQIGPDILTFLQSSQSFQIQSSESLTVFDSTGHAYADFLATHLILDYAETFGLGSDIDIECIPVDPLNPYSFLGKSNFRNPFIDKEAVSTPII